MLNNKIRLSDTEEVMEFVEAAGKCDFDINASYGRALVDAKSLLGMLYLGLSKELTIQCAGQDAKFERVMQKYAVA
jgi:phosphotransferase system HPr-like phosphotransfer protein